MDLLGATMQSRMLLLAGGLAVLTLLSGCGSSTPKPDPARVARLVAEANALCGSLPHRAIIAVTPKVAAVRDRLTAISKSLREAAAYLPAGKELNESHAKQEALMAEARNPASAQPDLLEQLYRVRLTSYDDLKALGLTLCLGKPPRPPISG
jgi:hypothetical protein